MAAGRAAVAQAVEAAGAETDPGLVIVTLVVVSRDVLQALLDEEGNEEQSGDRVGPPPGEEAVEAQPD